MRKRKSMFDNLVDSVSGFDKSLGLTIKFPELTEYSLGDGLVAKKTKQKPKQTNILAKRKNAIYSGAAPINYKEADEHDNLKNTDMFNFNLVGRIKQQQ